jgi:Ca2+:H+ antiporter
MVYGMYLLFQLKSHAYMYESTPQHIIDEESAPGPVAAWMESSDDDSSSSSSSDSDGSSGSNTTAKRIRRVMRGGRRRRKSSFGSKETTEVMDATRTPSLGTSSISPLHTNQFSEEPASYGFGQRFGVIDVAEDGDDENHRRSRKNSVTMISKKERKRERKRQEKKNRKKARRNGDDTITEGVVDSASAEKAPEDLDAPRRVDFAVVEQEQREPQSDNSTKRPFTLRNITSIRSQIPKTFSQNIFTQPPPNLEQVPTAGLIPRVRYGIRRTNSLPDRLYQSSSAPAGQGQRVQPTRITSLAVAANNEKPSGEEENISRTTALFLLLISTGLVAVCAEFMVDSINAVVSGNSGLSEAFIGLIILPIVGNAAEHVTAVTVASKNKMDLAIGVAVGSSIQIGKITPSLPPSIPY